MIKEHIIIAGIITGLLLFPVLMNKIKAQELSYRGVVCIPEPCREVWSQKWQR